MCSTWGKGRDGKQGSPGGGCGRGRRDGHNLRSGGRGSGGIPGSRTQVAQFSSLRDNTQNSKTKHSEEAHRRNWDKLQETNPLYK